MMAALAGCAPAPRRPPDPPVATAATAVPPSAFPKPDRPVADIVSDRWSDETDRDAAGEAERVMRLLGIVPGMAVADIGAGSGYYTVRLAQQVGAEGRVYAEDIVPDYLQGLRQRLAAERPGNVTVIQGEAHDPHLPPASVDIALLVHMYHEIEQPFGLLWNLRPALRSGARVAIVDADRPTNRHGTPPALLRCELAAVGFRQVALDALGASGYLAVFDAGSPPAGPGAIRSCAGEP